MGTIRMDIDAILDQTYEYTEEEPQFQLNLIEIDNLLENTRHW